MPMMEEWKPVRVRKLETELQWLRTEMDTLNQQRDDLSGRIDQCAKEISTEMQYIRDHNS
jgi:hypothetical protein